MISKQQCKQMPTKKLILFKHCFQTYFDVSNLKVSSMC